MERAETLWLRAWVRSTLRKSLVKGHVSLASGCPGLLDEARIVGGLELFVGAADLVEFGAWYAVAMLAGASTSRGGRRCSS